MTGTNVGTAYLEVIPSAKGFAGKLQSELGGDMAKAGSASGKQYSGGFSKGIKGIAGAIGATVALSAGINFFQEANAEARESQKVNALSAQVIKSTGGAANQTAQDMGNLATAISNKVGVDDEAIQSGENLLATFTNIRNEAGRGNKIFNQATQASVDLAAGLAAASGGELNLRSSTTLVGKALNDPIKGLTALGRVGVAFTDKQKERIKGFVKEGKTLSAQKVILRELGREFGGAAEAQATAGEKAAVSIGNLKEQIGLALLPTVDKLANLTTKRAVPAISKFVSGMQDGTGAGGEFADTVKNDLLPVAKNLAGEAKLVFGALKPVLGVLKELPPGLVATGGAAALLGSKLGGLRSPLAANASGFEKLGRSGASLAGGVGLLAVADAGTQTSRVLGTLEGAAGGAAIGLSVAGPLGAAVGGIGGALLGLFTSGHQAADGIDAAAVAAEQAVPKVNSYATSLLGVSAAQTKATRAIAAENFQKNKALFDGTGLNPRVIINGLLGQKKALQQINAVLDKNYNIAAKNQQNLLGQLATTQKNLAVLKGDPAFKSQYDILVKQEAAQKRALEDAVKLTNTLGDRRAKQNKLLDGLTEEANKTRELRSQALSYKDLLNMGIAPAVARAFNGKTSVGPYTADVANLIDKFHILDQGKWDPIIRAAGLKPGADTVAAILRDLKNIARDRTANLKINITANTNSNVAEQGLPPYPGGRDGNVSTPYPRKLGGPVSAGQPYIVGERRPELFVPSQSGRIIPRVPQAAASSPISPTGQRFSLTITNWRDGTGYFENVATSMVDSSAGLAGETDRAL